MHAKKLIILFILLLGFQSFAEIHYFSNIDPKTDSGFEVFSAQLDLENPENPKNQQILKAYREELGMSPDTPIVIRGLTNEQRAALKLDGTGASISEMEQFLNQFQLDNPKVASKIKDEIANYHVTGVLPDKIQEAYINDFVESYIHTNPNAEKAIVKEAAAALIDTSLPEKLRKQITESLLNKDWLKTNQAIDSYFLHTKVKGLASKIPYIKTLSKGTFALTLFRVIYNGSITSAVTFASTGQVAVSLANGIAAAGVTGLIQVNHKFFEKLMTGNYWKSVLPKFWGIEALVVSVLKGVSYALKVPDTPFVLGEFLFDSIIKMGGLTVLTQPIGEYFAVRQGNKVKQPIDAEIMRIKSLPNLSKAAKSLIMSRLISVRASASLAFQRVMVTASAIWATSMAFEAALPEAAKDVAVYGTFIVLGAYGAAIATLGVNRINSVLMAPIKLAKNINQRVKKIRKAAAKKLKVIIGGPTFCDSYYK